MDARLDCNSTEILQKFVKLVERGLDHVGSAVTQNGGSEPRRNPPYRAVAGRGSGTATIPRPSMVRSSRPAPWTSSSVACDTVTAMNPLPPCAATARRRAAASGSSGRGRDPVDDHQVQGQAGYVYSAAIGGSCWQGDARSRGPVVLSGFS